MKGVGLGWLDVQIARLRRVDGVLAGGGIDREGQF